MCGPYEGPGEFESEQVLRSDCGKPADPLPSLLNPPGTDLGLEWAPGGRFVVHGRRDLLAARGWRWGPSYCS